MALKPTNDPHVFIEAQAPGYIRYVNKDGRRWSVTGTCDRRGDCLIGAVINGIQIRDHAHLEEVKLLLGVNRLVSELDVPVTPEFNVCCGADIFKYKVLESR